MLTDVCVSRLRLRWRPQAVLATRTITVAIALAWSRIATVPERGRLPLKGRSNRRWLPPFILAYSAPFAVFFKFGRNFLLLAFLIVDAACIAWRKLVADPETITFGMR